uniref:Uncharacterized protein n=1 Tax=Cacopsylla melanoneura TaxID=428564 RepID=A0A8D8PL83_9HEMI
MLNRDSPHHPHPHPPSTNLAPFRNITKKNVLHPLRKKHGIQKRSELPRGFKRVPRLREDTGRLLQKGKHPQSSKVGPNKSPRKTKVAALIPLPLTSEIARVTPLPPAEQMIRNRTPALHPIVWITGERVPQSVEEIIGELATL